MPKRASKHALPPPLPIVNAKIRSTHVMSQRYELCTLLQVGQPKRPRQQIADLSVLYAQASFLNEHFQLKVLNWSGPHDAVVGRLFKGNAAPLGCPQHAQIHTHTHTHTQPPGGSYYHASHHVPTVCSARTNPRADIQRLPRHACTVHEQRVAHALLHPRLGQRLISASLAFP